jgi:hypothetical protein
MRRIFHDQFDIFLLLENKLFYLTTVIVGNSSTEVCMASEKDCYENVRSSFETKESLCGCLNPCKYVKYNVKTEAHFGLLDQYEL